MYTIKTTYVLFIALVLASPIYAQNYERPKENCGNTENGARVRPDDLVSWCQNPEDNHYDACGCAYEKELQAWEDLLDSKRKEMQALSDKVQQEKKKCEALYDEAYKLEQGLEQSNSFDADKAKAIANLNQCIRHYENQIRYLQEADEIRRAVFKSNFSSDYKSKEDNIAYYKSDIRRIEGIEKKSKSVGKLSLGMPSDDAEDPAVNQAVSGDPSQAYAKTTNPEESAAEIQKRLEKERVQQQLARQQQEMERIDNGLNHIRQDLGNTLGDLFTGNLNPNSVMTLTKSLLESGLINSLEGIGMASIGGGLLAAGVGAIKEAKQNKIKNNANRVREGMLSYNQVYADFDQAIQDNDEVMLLSYHNKLAEMEGEMIESATYLINKADQGQLRELKTHLEDANLKRSQGMQKVKTRVMDSFHALSAEKKSDFARSGTLSEFEINELREPPVQDGAYRKYHANWQLAETGMLKSGRKSGLWKTFYQGGDIHTQTIYNDFGQELFGAVYYEDNAIYAIYNQNQMALYYPNGRIKEFGPLEQYNRKGLWSYYAEEGTLGILSEYEEGIANGAIIGFYEDGTKQYEGVYKNNQKDGIWNWYHDNGALEKSIRYAYDPSETDPDFMGLRVDVLSTYDRQGNPLDKGNLKNGEGILIEYNSNGTPKSIKAFRKGVLRKFTDKPKKVLKEIAQYQKKNPNGKEVLLPADDAPKQTLTASKPSNQLLEEVLTQFNKAELALVSELQVDSSLAKNQTTSSSSPANNIISGGMGIATGEQPQEKQSTAGQNSPTQIHITAEEVLEKVIARMGGKEKLNTIKTLRVKKRITSDLVQANIQQVMEGIMYYKSSNKTRIDITNPTNGLVISNRFNGQKGIMVYDGKTQPMNADSQKQMNSTTHIFLEMDYLHKIQSQKITRVEEIRLENQQAYRIQLEQNQETHNLFVNPKNYTLFRIEVVPNQPTTYAKSISTYSDFGWVSDAGIIYPKKYQMEIFDNQQKKISVTTFVTEGLDENIEINDSDFE